MTHAIMVLQQEHKSITRLLVLMRKLVDEMDDGESADVSLLHEIGAYLSGFPELCHHPKEDLIFRKMMSRDPTVLDTGPDLLQEHERLSGLIEAYVSSVAECGDDSGKAGKGFVVNMKALIDAYEHHMEMEEKHFFPKSISTLSDDDWAEIDYAMFEQDDPLFDEASTKYARLRDEIFALASEHEAKGGVEAGSASAALLSIGTVGQFNSLMQARNKPLALTKMANGHYDLRDAQRSVLEIPPCTEERAAWCAYCFAAGIYSG